MRAGGKLFPELSSQKTQMPSSSPQSPSVLSVPAHVHENCTKWCSECSPIYYKHGQFRFRFILIEESYRKMFPFHIILFFRSAFVFVNWDFMYLSWRHKLQPHVCIFALSYVRFFATMVSDNFWKNEMWSKDFADVEKFC